MPAALHHLAFRTDDVEALARFYRATFGFDVVRDLLPHSLWLGLGASSVLMIEKREPGETAVAAATLELVAFRVDEAAKERIRHEALAAGSYDGETEFTVYLRDPDGRRIGASTYSIGG
jgi:catechol 2,3-dioxygenase-like lactoylglutathione lyase family enzyme